MDLKELKRNEENKLCYSNGDEAQIKNPPPCPPLTISGYGDDLDQKSLERLLKNHPYYDPCKIDAYERGIVDKAIFNENPYVPVQFHKLISNSE